MLAWQPGVRAQAPQPPWRFADASARLVFAAPTGSDYALVRLPAQLPDGACVGQVRVASESGERPSRVLAVGTNELNLLVGCVGLAPGTPVAVYALTNGSLPRVDATFVDPLPVDVTVQRAGGHDAPPSWQDMYFLAHRQAAEQVAFRLPGFVPFESQSPAAWYKGGWERPTYVAQLRSWLVVTEPGEYVFALTGRTVAYLLVNGRLWVEQARDQKEDWTVGEPVLLGAGLHRLEVYTICEKHLRAQVGWRPPGQTTIESLPANRLATGADPVPGRWERLGQVVHAAAAWKLGPAYRFQGLATYFTPVQFDSLHAAWEGVEQVSCTWSSRGRPLGEGATVRTVLAETGLIPVTLRVRTALGMQASAELLVDVPARVAREYRVAGRLTGMPSVCYEDDPVRPEIQVRSTVPPEVELQVQAERVLIDGSVQTVREPVNLQQTWGRLSLPAGFALDLAAVHWQVRHADAVVASGRVRLVRPPFDRLPTGLDGDLLLAGEDVCVLVPRQGSHGDPASLPALRAGARLVVLDGFLCGAAGAAETGSEFDAGLLENVRIRAARPGQNDALQLRYQRISYATLMAPLSSQVFDRLAPLARLSELRGADVVVVAPDLGGVDAGEPGGDFERRLAALVTLIGDGVGARVVLVTPPPGLVRLADVADPSRLYAESIVRVADACGASVADVYSLCRARAAATDAPAGSLPPAWQALAAEAIAHTLTGGGRW